MTTMQTPSEDHAQFDAICAQTGDWETLPAVVNAPAEQGSAPSDNEHVAALNGLILAGLVSPY